MKNKIAYANFIRDENKNFDKIAALRFRKAILLTARQFPDIQRIEICLDGVADFWRVGTKKPKKCV